MAVKQMKLAISLACFAAVCLSPALARAQTPVAGWVADEHGCKVANPQPQPYESIRWSGRCVNGFVDGPGVVRWYSAGQANGSTSGTFKEGKLTGKGYVSLPHLVHGLGNPAKRAGEQPRTLVMGSRLTGEFHENRLIGEGVITRPNGQKIVVTQVADKLVRKGAAAPPDATQARPPANSSQ
jgi:hypothetical protein